MKLAQATSTAIQLLAAAAAGAQQEEGGFYDECDHEWRLGFGRPAFIAASCPDAGAGAGTHASFVSLQDCIANNEGVIEPSRGGRALSTCSGCSASGSNITCSCRRTFNGPVDATFDLNTVIRNADGILACFDFIGIEVKSLDDPPP